MLGFYGCPLWWVGVANGDGHPTSQRVRVVCVLDLVCAGFYGCPMWHDPLCCVFCCALINIIFKN
jgi:hypothetical protein